MELKGRILYFAFIILIIMIQVMAYFVKTMNEKKYLRNKGFGWRSSSPIVTSETRKTSDCLDSGPISCSNRVCKIIGTDILLLYEAILHLVSLTSNHPFKYFPWKLFSPTVNLVQRPINWRNL